MQEDLIRDNQGGLPRASRGATVYILQCANGQYYVGSTTNIARRVVVVLFGTLRAKY